MATFEEAAKEEILEKTPNPEENPRNKRMMEIASSEEDSKEGLEDVADEDHDKTVPVEEPVEEKIAPQKFKIKANGKEEELTQEELIKRAEMATGAEQKFQEAARLRKEAEELRAVPPKEEQAVDEDDRALARALQMGNEEEAAAVIRKIRTRPSQDADVDRRIDQRMEFRNSAAWFQQEYPDIVKDPNLLSLVLSEDEKLVKSGDKRSYKDRYGQIGDGLRKWMSGLKAPASTEERRERKANLQVVPSASVRAGAPVEDNDGPDDREFIAAEAKRRGQGYPK